MKKLNYLLESNKEFLESKKELVDFETVNEICNNLNDLTDYISENYDEFLTSTNLSTNYDNIKKFVEEITFNELYNSSDLLSTNGIELKHISEEKSGGPLSPGKMALKTEYLPYFAIIIGVVAYHFQWIDSSEEFADKDLNALDKHLQVISDGAAGVFDFFTSLLDKVISTSESGSGNNLYYIIAALFGLFVGYVNRFNVFSDNAILKELTNLKDVVKKHSKKLKKISDEKEIKENLDNINNNFSSCLKKTCIQNKKLIWKFFEDGYLGVIHNPDYDRSKDNEKYNTPLVGFKLCIGDEGITLGAKKYFILEKMNCFVNYIYNFIEILIALRMAELFYYQIDIKSYRNFDSFITENKYPSEIKEMLDEVYTKYVDFIEEYYKMDKQLQLKSKTSIENSFFEMKREAIKIDYEKVKV